MRFCYSILLIAGLGAVSALAQDVESYKPTLGLKAGIPLTDMFQAQNTNSVLSPGNIPTSLFTAGVPRYEMGASAEFHMGHVRFEIDGLFKRAGFTSSLPFAGATYYRPTTANVWEFPGLFKFNVSMGHVRPFVDVGASMRHISSITQFTYSSALRAPLLSNNSFVLHNRNSVGAVAGIGITFKRGPFELSPEVRYTRWANSSFSGPGFRTNVDQGDVLLGIGF
jgi:hypothetical protein